MSEPASPRRKLAWRILTGVSLALNVLVICAVAGLFLSKRAFDGDRPPPMRPGFVAPLIGVLPPGDRRAVLSELHAIGRAEGVTRGTQEEVRLRVIALLEAEPFDPEALRDLLDGSNAAFAGFTDRAHAVIIDRIAAMPPEERAEYVDRLKRFGTYRGGKDRDGGRKWDGGDGHGHPPHDPD
ncbi:periplasmic heavy metal sensor [Mangrovicoccus sp. HB161399]|uniref:periplasmic heavy metal sensor n=1 Tax=Mangrovicoccus sp. HB161399 TaxID=2720392 RepID=UPI0015547D80|nr:periplasmic heavy metal sensor [Mangrovicoccus sp. HB161399]